MQTGLCSKSFKYSFAIWHGLYPLVVEKYLSPGTLKSCWSNVRLRKVAHFLVLSCRTVRGTDYFLAD